MCAARPVSSIASKSNLIGFQRRAARPLASSITESRSRGNDRENKMMMLFSIVMSYSAFSNIRSSWSSGALH